MPGVDLSDYVEVSERIEKFRERHPEGSLQARFIDVPPPFNEGFIAIEVRAFRTPDDERPGIDIAWEPVPGKTQWTKDSEVMNASTSAAGRAIVYALAADAHRGVASANEVRAREYTEAETPAQTGFASEKQEKYLRRLIGTDADQNLIVGYLEANHHGGRDGGISRAIDKLKEDETRADTLLRLEALATEWDKQQPATENVVPDDEDLSPLDDLTRDE